MVVQPRRWASVDGPFTSEWNIHPEFSTPNPGCIHMCAAACAQTMLVQPAPLSVRGVFASLHRMAAQKGAGAAKRRTQTILALLRSCRSPLSPPGLPPGHVLPCLCTQGLSGPRQCREPPRKTLRWR